MPIDTFAEIKKCQVLKDGAGFLYWAENYSKVFHPARGIVTPKFCPVVQDLIKTFFNEHFVIVLKSRQIGMSTLFSLIDFYTATLFPGSSIGIISRTRQDSIGFLEKGKWCWKYLPAWLRPKLITDNKMSMQWLHGSKILTSAPVKNAFRSETLDILEIDEVVAARGIVDIYTAAYLTISQNLSKLRTRNAPWGLALISTGGYVIEPQVKWFYQMWDKALHGEIQYKPFKVHWSDVGMSEEWYKEQCKILNWDKDRILTELDCGFVFRSRNKSVFDEELLKSIARNISFQQIADYNSNYQEILESARSKLSG